MTVFEEYSVEIMKLIFGMTFIGSIISLLLFMLKPVIKERLPQTFQYYMWFAAVAALLLPVPQIIAIPVSNPWVETVKPVHGMVRWISGTASEKPVNPDIAFPGTAVILFLFWQVGMILFLGFHIICYLFCVRRFRRCNMSADRQEMELLSDLSERKKTLRLYKNPIVETPILIGFFRPAVILPVKKYEGVKLRNILLHEMTHWKRHDIFVKWLLILVGALHWFNPLVYLVRREINKMCELACDEAVIRKLDIPGMQQYGDTLIAVAADSIRKIPLPIAMFEEKKILKERLDAIMKHKKHSKRTVIAAGVLLLMAVCVILGFSTLQVMADGHNYADNYSLPQDRKNIQEIELRNAIRDYDKKNIVEAYVYLSDLDGEITNAYIMIVCHEKNPDSEMQSEISALVSEELGLDIQNIYVDYMDYESFTSDERRSQ